MRITYQCTINEEDTLTRYAPQWGPKEKGPIWNEGIFFLCFCVFHVKIAAFQTGPKETWHDMERSELVGEKNGTSPLHDFGLLPSKESDMFNLIIRATQLPLVQENFIGENQVIK